MEPSALDLAYAAGILDGEGSVVLTRNRKNRWPSPQVSISSNDYELMLWLRERFGGSVVKTHPRKPEHAVSYEWKVTDRKALGFLTLVRPYLVIERKKVRADLLLEAYLACTPRNGRYTDEMRLRKQELIEKFASLP